MKSTNNPSGTHAMSHPLKKRLFAAAIVTAGAMPMFAYAQASMDHGSMNMSTMDHSSMDMSNMDHGAGTAQAKDHGATQPSQKQTSPGKAMPAMQGMTHDASPAAVPASAHNMGAMSQGGEEMDHGAMQMQGGSAPPDARDPNGYSDGYVRNAGKYALPPSEALVMSDMHNFGSVTFDRLEYVRARGNEWAAYEGEAWYGSTYNRAALKAEGEVASGKLRESKTQLLWRHAVATFWDTELGVRFDHGQGEPNRKWLAFGFKGLAPYWFDVDATAYVGPSGRTALWLKTSYDILLTQKLYLQPSVEANVYGKDDERRGIGSGVSDGTAGLRLKYEVTRQLVPYVGVEWSGKFGKTADYARAEGEPKQETRFVAGVSFRF
jgi:copper resistance protein B